MSPQPAALEKKNGRSHLEYLGGLTPWFFIWFYSVYLPSLLEFLPISSLVQSGISPQSGAVPGSREHAWTWLAGWPVGCGLSHLRHSGPHTASTEQVARATPTQPGERRCGLGAGLQRPVHEAGCALIWGPLLPFAVRKELNHHPRLQEGQDSPPTRGASHRAHTPPPDGARGRRA